MNEVEKMYENAIGKVCTHTIINPERCNKRRMTRCCGCDYYAYPPFTADKQIELIKFLSNFWVHINKVNEQFNISTGGGYVSYYAEDLADAIALYINSKWNNLTEQERTEIADILKG